MVNTTQAVASVASLILGGYLLWRAWQRNQRAMADPAATSGSGEGKSWRLVGRVLRLWLYPIKSCAPLQLTEAKAEPRGLLETTYSVRDRSYLIVMNTGRGVMVTGRMCPQSVLVTPQLEANGDLTLSYPGQPPCTVTLHDRSSGATQAAKVWSDPVEGVDCGDSAAHWLSTLLKREVRLLYHDDVTSARMANPTAPVPLPMLKPGQDGSLYADLTGYMLLTTASVQQLQQQVGHDLPPLQFRPNILVTSCDDSRLPPWPAAPDGGPSPCSPLQPYQEDDWTLLRIGDSAVFRNVKPCTRCIFTCVSPDTGEMNKQREPLNTLKKHRLPAPWEDPLFGINLGLDQTGTIREGDPVYALL